MKYLWSVFAIVLLAFQQPGKTASRPSDKPLTMAQVWTLDATYRDPVRGVTFRYPSAWPSTRSLAYHPPVLEYAPTPPIAEFGHDEGGFPREQIVGPYSSTNLDAVGIVYSALSAASASQCDKLAGSLTETESHKTETIGGRSFAVFESGDASMSSSTSSTLYVTWANRTCYLFETDVAVADAQVVDLPGLTKPQLTSICAHLDEIVKSLRIASPQQDNPSPR